MSSGRLRGSTALLAAAGSWLLLGHCAAAGDLVPGGWLQPYRVPDAGPVVARPPAPSGTSIQQPRKQEPPHKAENPHRVEARGHRPAPVREPPPANAGVRF